MTIPPGLNNHVEMVHRPGEGGLALKLLTLLGCEPISSPYPYKGVHFHFSKTEQMWVSDVSAEQWAFELWLQEQVKTHPSEAAATFLARLDRLPQAHGHFGIGLPTLAAWEEVVARLQDAVDNDVDFMGRLSLPIVQPPDHPESVCAQTEGRIGCTLYQAFVRTDIISTGLLTLGQTIEIQHYRENDPAYDGPAKRIQDGL